MLPSYFSWKYDLPCELVLNVTLYVISPLVNETLPNDFKKLSKNTSLGIVLM